MKLEVLRNLYDQVQVAVIDPEDEYVRLGDAVGASIVQLGAPGIRLNPFDLPPADRRPDALTRRALFIHTLIAVLLGEQPPPAERAALDRAIIACYHQAGITNDPTTWTRPAPLMADLAATLTQLTHGQHGGQPSGHGGHDGGQPGGHDGGHSRGHGAPAGHPGNPDAGGHMSGAAADNVTAAAVTLAAWLSPWVEGSFRDLFAGPSTVHPSGHLVVWSTRHLPDELRAAGMLLALDAIWRDIDSPGDTRTSGRRLGNSGHRLGNSLGGWVPNSLGSSGTQRPTARRPVGRRLVVVDEAWSLMRESEGARFLARMAKSARKRRAGLAVVTQDAADLLASDLGQVVVANAATQILMRQAPQAIDEVAATFALTAGEARMLLSAERGHALLLAGSHRIGFQTVASATEHDLITTGLEFDGISGDSAANSGMGSW